MTILSVSAVKCKDVRHHRGDNRASDSDLERKTREGFPGEMPSPMKGGVGVSQTKRDCSEGRGKDMQSPREETENGPFRTSAHLGVATVQTQGNCQVLKPKKLLKSESERLQYLC